MFGKILKFFIPKSILLNTEPALYQAVKRTLDCRPLIQTKRTDMYYKTLAKELENGAEFYNHATGNVIQLTDKPSFIRVFNSGKELLHMEDTPIGFMKLSRIGDLENSGSKYLHFGNSKIEIWKPDNLGHMSWVPKGNISL